MQDEVCTPEEILHDFDQAVASFLGDIQPDNFHLMQIDDHIFTLYNRRCGNCITAESVCIHEIVPKSKRPGDWWMPSNRIPLCHSCHDEVHTHGPARMADQLETNRARLLEITTGGLRHEFHFAPMPK